MSPALFPSIVSSFKRCSSLYFVRLPLTSSQPRLLDRCIYIFVFDSKRIHLLKFSLPPASLMPGSRFCITFLPALLGFGGSTWQRLNDSDSQLPSAFRPPRTTMTLAVTHCCSSSTVVSVSPNVSRFTPAPRKSPESCWR